MNLELAIVVGAIAAVTTVSAGVLSYLSERSAMAVGFLATLAAIAGSLCVIGTLFGHWIGLLTAVLLVTLLAYRIGARFGKKRRAIFLTVLWLGYCMSCTIGYWAGGWLGLFTITLPVLIIFWWRMLSLSRLLLPLADNSQQGRAFRSLLTFSLGTNFPYHILRDGELNMVVSGNPYGQLFAGPGIVLTGPSHAPVTSDGMRFRGIGRPGLTFTERFETVYTVVDLRPQLRSFFVEATTRDGIQVRVLLSIPFRLHAKGQEPELGTSFPFDAQSIYKAVWQQLIDRGEAQSWDEIVPMWATLIAREVIANYRFEDLYRIEPQQYDVRTAIRNELLTRLQSTLEPKGIEVLGGGISNILSVQEDVTRALTRGWQERLQKQADEQQLKQLRSWRAQALARFLSEILDVCEGSEEVDDMVDSMAHFLDRRAEELALLRDPAPRARTR